MLDKPTSACCYGVATISRMLKNIGLFCKRDLQKRPIFCKETYIFKHPTHRSHPIKVLDIMTITRTSSVLHHVAVCCSELQCVAVRLLSKGTRYNDNNADFQCVAVGCIMLQCVAVSCSVLQCVYLLNVLDIMTPQLTFTVLQ